MLVFTVTPNRVVSDRVAAAVRRAGGEAVAFERFESLSSSQEQAPDAIVIDLDIPNAAGAPALLRDRWPRALLAGFVSLPDPSRWEDAKAGGFDLVATRGAIGAQLVSALPRWTGPAAGKRIRLMDEQDLAGRIGCVLRTDHPDLGPIAVYHVAKTVHVAADVCPHAGARLSEGTLEGTVVTCPRHGSQFDVATGARVRGPSDQPIAVFQVRIEDGAVSVDIGES